MRDLVLSSEFSFKACDPEREAKIPVSRGVKEQAYHIRASPQGLDRSRSLDIVLSSYPLPLTEAVNT